MGGKEERAVVRDPKEIVARGYDAIALRYAEWVGKIDSPSLEWLRDLDARLGEGSDVLELGCGRGVPTTRELARRHRVTGVDISAVQIELARHHVPEASFVHGDATELDVATLSLDAVVALSVFGHIPCDEQAPLLEAIGGWLREGGFLLVNFPAGESGEELDPDWLGTAMFFASLSSAEYGRILDDACLERLRDEVIGQNEPDHGQVFFRWVLARSASAT